jgi:hypothetical protein
MGEEKHRRRWKLEADQEQWCSGGDLARLTAHTSIPRPSCQRAGSRLPTGMNCSGRRRDQFRVRAGVRPGAWPQSRLSLNGQGRVPGWNDRRRLEEATQKEKERCGSPPFLAGTALLVTAFPVASSLTLNRAGFSDHRLGNSSPSASCRPERIVSNLEAAQARMSVIKKKKRNEQNRETETHDPAPRLSLRRSG